MAKGILHNQYPITTLESIGAAAKDHTHDDKADKTVVEGISNKLKDLTNIMDFVGAFESKPDVKDYKDGNVIVITAGEDAGKEFILSDNEWKEFGNATAISSLDGRISILEGHNHDNVYAVKEHTHTVDNITNLETTLANYSKNDHTHDIISTQTIDEICV